MPTGLVLHEADTLALDGVHEDAGGLAGTLGLMEEGEGFFDLVKVVAVNGGDVAAEGLALFVHRGGVHHVAGPAVNLQAVQVDDDAQVIQVIVGGEHQRLPDLALGDLAVT